MPTVISRMTSGVRYTFYEQGAGGQISVSREIRIKGGASLQDRRTLQTPQGVVTSITDEELALLESHELFQEHKANGVILVEKGRVKDADKTAEREMGKDKSAPPTPQDYAKRGKKPPKTGKAE